MEAAEAGNVTDLAALLTDGCDINVSTANGASGLMHASAGGHAAAVELLLAQGAHINARRHDGWTALTLAAFFGHAEVVEVLLRAGADPQATDDSDNTALDWASARGQVEIAALLRRAGAGRAGQPQRRNAEHAADDEVAAEAFALRAEAHDETTLLRSHAAVAVGTVSNPPPHAGGARLDPYNQRRGRNDAVRARTRVSERKRAHRITSPPPRVAVVTKPDPVEAAPPAPAVITAGSRERKWRGHRSVKALRFIGGVALWLVTFSCTAYTLMSVLGLSLKVAQHAATDKSRAGAQSDLDVRPATALTPPAADVQPAPPAPVAAPAPKEVKILPATVVTAGGEKQGALNQTSARAARKPERSDEHTQQPETKDAAKTGRKRNGGEPVLISQANETTKAKRESVSADDAGGAGHHDTHLPPRFVAPLAAPASPSPVKPSTRKVIPWP